MLADPYELRNLIAFQSHREVAEVMRARLLRRIQETGEVEPHIELAPATVPAAQWRVTSEAHG